MTNRKKRSDRPPSIELEASTGSKIRLSVSLPKFTPAVRSALIRAVTIGLICFSVKLNIQLHVQSTIELEAESVQPVLLKE